MFRFRIVVALATMVVVASAAGYTLAANLTSSEVPAGVSVEECRQLVLACRRSREAREKEG